MLTRTNHLRRTARRHVTRYPGRVLVTGVAALIALGTAGLLWPGAQGPVPLEWVDALLLATSAVCTTGLSSVNVAEVLSPAGQVWLTLLIEVGALALLALAFGFVSLGRQGAAARVGAAAELGLGAGQNLRGLLRRVVRLALGIQLVGLLLLLPDMVALEGWGQGSRYALMHSVMAFGNAGFGLWPDGVARLSAPALLTLMALVGLGGLGFVTLHELGDQVRARRAGLRPARLSTLSRVGLRMTAFLLLLGWVGFALLEWNRPGTLGALPWSGRLLHAAFQPTVARSAGFATLDYGTLAAPTLLLLMGLMFVGGNPGSTAGGIKTTTAAVLVAATRAGLRRRQDPELAGRRIGSATLTRALTVVTLGVVSVVTGTFALMLTEGDQDRPIALAFEAVSAFTTAGLSVNLTPQLSSGGKLVLVVLMFLGRVGFLSLLLAFRPTKPALVRLPEERDLTVG